MINCSECLRLLGSEPSTSAQHVLEHVSECSSCADCRLEYQELDRTIVTALKIPVPNCLKQSIPMTNGVQISITRTSFATWWGIAATLVVTAGTSIFAWQWNSQNSIQEQAFVHVNHAPEALRITDVPIARVTLIHTRQCNGARLTDNVGLVS